MEKTIVAPAQEAKRQDFQKGGANSLAILLTDPQSDWLSIAFGLRSIGIPFIVTTDYREALTHRVVLVYPNVTGRSLSSSALEALTAFPAHGGTLIVQHALGGGFDKLIGFESAVVKNATELRFKSPSPLVEGLDDPEEKDIRIGGKLVTGVGTYAYINPKNMPLAVYEDGSAAILGDKTGRAFAFGIDLGYLFSRGYNNRQQDIAQNYANAYEPTLDVLLRCLKNIYRQGEKNAVTLGTVPQGKQLAVLFTHDIDYTRSLVNALAYAEFERSHGITATYFMQVKYVRDWNDDVFFTPDGVHALRKLQTLGMEIASHTVSHTRAFRTFPLGDGLERYPDYAPFVVDKKLARGGSILGELRVSKFMLEQTVPGLQVASFRPGHLAAPYALPQALEATGYRYSSSVTANDSLTHLPFQLTYNRETSARTAIFEFPLTIEDELDGPMDKRLPQAIALAHKLGRYGGLFVILIHPDILGHKMAFEKGFVEAMGDKPWYGSVAQFGDWWSARNEIDVDARNRGRGVVVVTLRAPRDIEGLALDLPAGWSFQSSTAGVSVSQKNQRVILGRFSGNVELLFRN
ncbi:MAG: hypothetical protein ABTQ34_05165 [Bdellovibrionales bacterium]